ncbi:hypothetical protein ACJMK2_042830 [Sinanodonta woodiana]|uniref:Tox-ART-HYD1 domain-containing protein n=1 Tax=Sinanodonta woodiana TaxID=1069815 RepID=A0ABD3VVQ7_SINWO
MSSKEAIKLISMILFHHTDLDGYKGICRDGKIKESLSDGADAAFGQGVYLTSLGPEWSANEVIINNWGDAQVGISQYVSKVQFIIQVSVQEQNVIKAPDGRDIYIHKGEIPKRAIMRVYRRDDMGNACSFQSRSSS